MIERTLLVNEDGIELELYEEKFPINNYKSKPLYSVIISSYHNTATLLNSISSVLEQKYPRIELIVGDDGSEDFKCDSIYQFIINNHKKNLERIVIRKFRENQGTVLNIKDSLTRIKGEYYSTIGADDLLNDPYVINDCVNCFNSNPDAWWLIGRITVVSFDYKTAVITYPPNEMCNTLSGGDKLNSLGFFTYRGMPAPGVSFKNGIADLVGGIDLHYKYLEDWPLYIKLLKNNYPPTFFNRYIVKQGTSGITKDRSASTLSMRKQYV